MSKLFKLKKWLTVRETAKHLSGVLGEDVQEKDVLRLALDGHLKLSINFVNHAQARLGEIVGYDDVIWYEPEPGSLLYDFYKESDLPTKVMHSINVDNERYINLEQEVKSIYGIWELLMVAGERLDIEHIYQSLLGGPEITLENIDGSFVLRGKQVAQLQERFDNNEYQEGSKAQKKLIEKMIVSRNIPFDQAEKMRNKYDEERKKFIEEEKKRSREDNFYPSGGLPNDALLVVKTSEIMNFLLSLGHAEQQIEKPLKSKERNTLLVMIAALCRNADIDYKKKGITAAFEMITDKNGTPLSDDTIRKVLKQLDDAVSTRSK